MITELRVYTVKRGMMGAWLKLFEKAVAQNTAHGIRLEYAGVDPENMGTFVWLRTFRNEQDRQARLEALYGSAWWQRVSDHVMSHVVNYEVRVLRTALVREEAGRLRGVFDTDGAQVPELFPAAADEGGGG